MPLVADYIQEFGRFQRNARLYLLSNILSGVTFGITLVLYNLYLIALGYRTDFVGLVLFVGTLGAGISIFPAGICVDRFSGKAILIWSSVAIGVAGTGQILFRQPLPLLISIFLVGVGSAFVFVVNAPFLTRNSTSTERPLLFSVNIVVTLVTTVIGEVLGGVLPIWFRTIGWLMAPLPSQLDWILVGSPEPRSYQLALLLAGIIAFPSFIPLFFMRDDRRPREPKPVLPAIKGRSLRQHVALNVAIWRKQFSLNMLLFSPLSIMVFVQALTGLGAGLLIPYFNIYFVQHLKTSSALFGLLDGGANTLNAIATLLAPRLASRIGRLNTIVVTRLLSIPILLTFGFTNLFPLAAVLYLCRLPTMDMSNGILQVFSMEVVPEKHRGLANSSYQAAYQVAWAVTASLGGLIITLSGFSLIFILTAVLYLGTIVLLWSRFRDTGEGNGDNDGRDELE